MAELRQITVKCIGYKEPCENEFIITTEEQKFYAKKAEMIPGFALPKRCPSCRKKKKEDALKQQEAESAV